MKLSRKAVAEALQTVPVDVVLLGAVGAKQTKLTPKQRKFAEGLAMGQSKAAAYREAYNSKAKPHHQSLEGQRLAANPAVAQQIEALQLANEAMRYATPAALRALVIQKLTEHAISDEVKPAQRLQALKLLGTVTEIAAFTERREIIKTTDPATAKAALLENLRQALRATSIDAEIVERPGASLTPVSDAGQLSSGDDDQGAAADPQPVAETGADDPTGAAPPRARDAQARTMLSNPHTQSQLDSAPHTQPSLLDSTEAEGMGAATPSDSLASLTHVSDAVQHKGGGGDEVWRSSEDVDMETPPGGNWKEK